MSLLERIKTAIRFVLHDECPMCRRRPSEASHLKRIVDQPFGPATERGYIPCPLCRTERFRVKDISHTLVEGKRYLDNGCSLHLKPCDPNECPRCHRERIEEEERAS